MTGQLPKDTSRFRVMIADDVQETRRSIRLMLSVIPGIEVVAIAQNGRQAVELAREYQPDICLMDVNMPELDGLSAIRAILQAHPDTVCIVISAERDSLTLRTAISSGARGYLIKPFIIDELEDAIQQAAAAIQKKRQENEKNLLVTRQRNEYLKQLAQEYVAARRTDDKALEVFENLAEDPACERRWLMTLAMIYVIRHQWSKLKALAERLEQKEEIKDTLQAP